MSVRVTAPAVQVVAGARVHHLAQGAVLPEGVSVETIERLTAKGLVVEDSEKASTKRPRKSTQTANDDAAESGSAASTESEAAE